MNKEIKVKYLFGCSRSDFLELENFGFEVDIPEELDDISSVARAHILEPSDYIIIFSIHFSLEFIKALAKSTAKELTEKFPKAINSIWNKHKDSKPAIVHGSKENDYKKPKAILTFKISKSEVTTFEITPNFSEEELARLLEFQLELTKMQYKHRKKENKLRQKRKK